MSGVSLSAIALAITNLSAVAGATVQLYKYASDLMEVTENAFQGTSGQGASKKEAVMAAVQKLAEALKVNWSGISAAISAFIDSIKTAYNAMKQMWATPSAA